MSDRSQQVRRISNFIRRAGENDPDVELVIAAFEQVVSIDDSLVTLDRKAEDLSVLLLEVCRRYNYTRPFEVDGTRRHFRPSMIGTNDGYGAAHASDCGWGSDFNPVAEQAYRRGYDQGFAEARRLALSGADLEARQKQITAWRISVFYDGPLPPGEAERWRLPFRPRSSLSATLRYTILARDNHTCQSCGARSPEVCLHVDHILPVALGGSDDPANLQVLCDECNLGKGARAKA